MPDDDTSTARLLAELDALRRESAERTAALKQLAADVHQVLSRKAMAGALISDTRTTVRWLPDRLRRALTTLRRRPS